MQSNDKDGAVVPLLVRGASGALVLAALTNDKGYNKSLENGYPWALDGTTGRLLPLADLRPDFAAALERAGRRPLARCVAKLERIAGNGAAVRLDIDLDGGLEAAPGVAGAAAGTAGAGANEAAGPAPAARTAGGQPLGEAERRELADFPFLLQDLIRRRRAEMPEGSYTTHLFKAGPGKIRKKTGEEAVELILAQGPQEIAAEASDLLYHLQVLLVDAGVPLEDVLAELRKR